MRFSYLSLFAVALVAVLVLAAPALASADPKAGEEGGIAKMTGLKRYDLGIFTLITFGLLMFILAKFAWPHIKEGLAKREVNIRAALDEAKQSQIAAKAELEKARADLAKAALDARAIVEEARKDAEALRAEQREIGVKEAAAERERARRENDANKEAMVKDVYEQAVKLAALISEKSLRRTVSADDHRRLLDESIAELKSTANKA